MRSLIALVLLSVTPLTCAAEVYRFISEDGVVTYTDQAPSPGAVPINVAPISVIETRVPEFAPPDLAIREADEGEAYADLSLLSPKPQETIQGTGNALLIRLQSLTPLRADDRVLVYLDETSQGAFESLILNLDGIPRGEHTVRVEIAGADGQIIASAGPVTFYMKQHSIQHNQGPFAFPNSVPPGR